MLAAVNRLLVPVIVKLMLEMVLPVPALMENVLPAPPALRLLLLMEKPPLSTVTGPDVADGVALANPDSVAVAPQAES